MRPGREIDAQIAEEVFGHRVWAQAKQLFENAEKGERPLRNYSKEIEWAWEVAEKMKITLIPVEGSQWFAFTGPIGKAGWESPQAVLQFLEAGDYNDCGAAVGGHPALVICEAALKATEKRRAAAIVESAHEAAQNLARKLKSEGNPITDDARTASLQQEDSHAAVPESSDAAKPTRIH